MEEVFSSDLSEITNIEDLYIELMYQETYTQLIDEIENVLANNTIYNSHLENGYLIDSPADRLYTKNMSVELYTNMTYLLGNNSATAPLMLALNEIFQQTFTS